MNRSLSRLAAALLLGTALTACSMISGSAQQASVKPSDTHAAASPAKTLAADLDTQIRQAQLLRTQGDFAGATKMLSQLMMVAPDDPRVVGEYGKNLVQQGRSKDAIDFLKRAVQLQPGDWTLYSAMGVAQDQSGDYANARASYQQALVIKPGNPGVLNNYALSRMQAGDLVSARQLMAQASTADTANAKITHNVALLASLAPAQSAGQVAPHAQVVQEQSKSVTPPKPLVVREVAPHPGVIMQDVPVDALAGRVKPAATAPHKVATAAPHKLAAAASTLPVIAAPRRVVVEDAKKSAKSKTPALRMTADAATP